MKLQIFSIHLYFYVLVALLPPPPQPYLVSPGSLWWRWWRRSYLYFMCSAFTFGCTHNSSNLFTPLTLLFYPGDTWHLSWRWADLCLRGSRALPPHPGGRPALLSSTCLPRTAGICNRNTRWCVTNPVPGFFCCCFKEWGVFQPVNSSSLSLEFAINSDPHLFFNLYVHAEGTISARGYILKCTYYSWEGVRSGRKTDAAASVRLQQKGDVSFCQLVRSTRLVDVLPPKHYLQHILLIQMFEMTCFSLNILAPAVSKSGELDVHN